MKAPKHLFSAAAVSGALLIFSGCVTSEQAGILGSAAGSIGQSVASSTGVGYVGTSAIGHGARAATSMVVTVLATHEASEEQRRIAEARAEAYMAGLNEGQRREVQKRRYLAVETKRDSRSKGRSSVMVFDTKNDRLVGNEVMDVKKAPATGSTAQFDTVDTTYVGA
jgi:hypothetical protein